MNTYSIKNRMLLSVAVGITGIVAAFLVWIVFQSYHRDLESLQLRGQLISKVQADALSVPLWEVNYDKIKVMLTALSEDRDFRSATVLDASNKEISYVGSRAADPSDFVFSQKIYDKSGESEGGQLLGTLKMAFSRDDLYQMLKHELFQSSITFAILLIVTLITIYLALTQVITKPLTNITSAIGRMAGGDLRHRLPDSRQREFNELAGAFNKITAELQEIYQTLEDRNLALTVTSEALDAARLQAESASKAKSQFLSKMSHELRTPLNAIIGYAEILSDDIATMSPDEMVSDLNKITTAGRHLLDLITDVLDITKIEAGKVSVHLETFTLSQFIDQIIDITRPMAEKNNNKLEIIKQQGVDEVHSDKTKMKQILVNLLGNAAKFTENGHITLEISQKSINNAKWISFRVSDTGIGMTEEQLEKIFHPFVQADSSTTRRFGGSGLGLAISKEFCKILGGDIYVSSKLNEGSSFTISLPLLAQEPEKMRITA